MKNYYSPRYESLVAFIIIKNMTGSSRPKYVPKGGPLVDFEKRLTPKLKRILTEEKQAQERTLVRNDKTNVQDSTSPCMAMVLWSGDEMAEQSAQGANHAIAEAKEHAKAAICPKSGNAWKPPGCMKRALWKRPSRPKKAPEVVPEEVHVAVCPSCEQLEKEKEHVQKAKAELEEKQKQVHLKVISVESLVSKCSREKKEFEAYKVCFCNSIYSVVVQVVFMQLSMMCRNKSYNVSKS